MTQESPEREVIILLVCFFNLKLKKRTTEIEIEIIYF